MAVILNTRVYGLDFVKKLNHINRPFIIVGKLTSFFDLLLVWGYSPKNAFLVVNDINYLNSSSIIHFFLKKIDHVFLDSETEKGADLVVEKLKQGQVAIIFPEGYISKTGYLTKIPPVMGKILDDYTVPVVPLILFNKKHRRARALAGLFKMNLWINARLRFFEPVNFSLTDSMAHVKPSERKQHYAYLVYDLLSQSFFASQNLEISLFEQLLDAKAYYGSRRDQIIFEDINLKPMRYRRFLGVSLMMARKFEKLFDQPEKIGLMLANTIYFCLCFYGMQAAGIASYMVNYSAGIKNVLLGLKNSHVKVVITSRLFVEKANLADLVAVLEKNITVFYLEDLAPKISVLDKIFVLAASLAPRFFWRMFFHSVDCNKVAAILSTSGSEAKPKAVALSHRNFVANLQQVLTVLELTPQEILLNVLPGFHAFGLTAGIILPAAFGIKSFQYPSPLHYDTVPGICYRKDITILFATGTFLKGYAQRASSYDFKNLNLVVAGAEKLTDDTKKIYTEKFGIQVFEGYGCTETAPVLSLNNMMLSKDGSVGRLLPGIQYRLAPVAGIQKSFELHVNGPNKMLGYFMADDSGVVEPVAEWYETGDIVEVDEKKFITILGRKKRFIKVGGETVSLGLLEDILKNSFPDYQYAALRAVDKNGKEYIVLYTNFEQLDKSEVNKQLLAAELTGLLNPKIIRYIKELPLLGSGKVDYPALNEIFIESENA